MLLCLSASIKEICNDIAHLMMKFVPQELFILMLMPLPLAPPLSMLASGAFRTVAFIAAADAAAAAPQIQFYMRGPSGTGQVHADMYKDPSGSWQYTYLLVDVYSGSSQTPSRIHIVAPH